MNKRFVFVILLSIALFIIISGLAFTIYGYLTQVSFKIMGSDVPGFLFGIVAVFLGCRYTISLNKLKKRIDKSGAKFSWDNFKKSHSSTL
jgi:hypothetical protein